MKILMMTNTYLPHVGGVARSITQFSEQLRKLGHQVRVVAPEFDDMPPHETDVIRIPAIRNFNHTDFSVIPPVPHPLTSALQDFKPEIVHSHHPFLIGNIALRVAHNLEVPLVFTHHTKYEDYTHNLFVDGDRVKRFASQLATGYANLCDQVISPSQSMKEILLGRGVTTKIDAISTGVSKDFYGSDDDGDFRRELGIPEDAFVVGHLGRISKEKNIETLVSAAIQFLDKTRHNEDPASRHTCFALFGDGPETSTVKDMFSDAGLAERLYTTGMLDRERVPDAYRTMDAFLFSSQSETQGMVLTEAMASAKPVVAIDAPGVRDVVVDRQNGRLIPSNNASLLAEALDWTFCLNAENFQQMRNEALATAQQFTMEKSAERLESVYTGLIDTNRVKRPDPFASWTQVLHTIESEWKILTNAVSAATESLVD